MAKLIAYCGIDCAGCEAYIATQADDQAAKMSLLEKWRVDYHAPDMTLADVTCDGCTSSGRLGGYTHACPVYACANDRRMENCAHCDDYSGCETLQAFIAGIPSALENLEAIRAGL